MIHLSQLVVHLAGNDTIHLMGPTESLKFQKTEFEESWDDEAVVPTFTFKGICNACDLAEMETTVRKENVVGITLQHYGNRTPQVGQ